MTIIRYKNNWNWNSRTDIDRDTNDNMKIGQIHDTELRMLRNMQESLMAQ